MRRPSFADATFSIADFGAVADGKTDSTRAVQNAIDACHNAGGGHVLVPDGDWSVGALNLRSNVDLHLFAQATLFFSDDLRLFPLVLTRADGIEYMGHSPLIYAYGQNNIALTGGGTLDASATAAWNHGGYSTSQLPEQLDKPPAQRFVSGNVRSTFVEPYACDTVLIEGITLVGTQSWQLHPTLCSNVTIDGVTTTSATFQSTDACDPESCTDVVIQRCSFGAGDDIIALKSGRDADGRRVDVPCKNVVIMNCQGEGPDGFIVCGSESSGGIENVFAYNNWTYGRGTAMALHIKTNSQRGGVTRNINIDTLRGSGFRLPAIYISTQYDNAVGNFPPLIEDIQLRNFVIDKAPAVFQIEGDVLGLQLSQSTFTRIDHGIGNTTSPLVLSEVSINGVLAPPAVGGDTK